MKYGHFTNAKHSYEVPIFGPLASRFLDDE